MKTSHWNAVTGKLRESLERVVREKIQGNSLQTTDLAARINYVATQYGLDLKEQNQLHTFRLTSNDILNHRKSPVKEEFLRDLRAVAYAYRKMFAQDIPLKLFSVLPKQEIASSGKKKRWNTSAASVYALIMPMIPICMYIL